MLDFYNESPAAVRALIRDGKLVKPTAGMCGGYAQGNLVILPKDLAFDFLLFATRNKKPCPLLEVSDVGSKEFKKTAPGSDIYRDIPLYRVYRHGELVDETGDVTEYYRDDFVAFLIGCSFTFESALLSEGIPVRHIEQGCNVPMYITNVMCREAGIFKGPTVVSMRPIPYKKVIKSVNVTGRYPQVHGAPLHVGYPELIGIKDLSKPDFGDPVEIKEGEVPVFWACGVTPQAVVMNVKPEIVITHSPGYMFITDVKNSHLTE